MKRLTGTLGTILLAWVLTATGVGVAQTADLDALSPAQLVERAQSLTGTPEQIAADRTALADHVTGKYVTDAATVRTVPTEQWCRLAHAVRPGLSAEDKTLWIAKLRGSFTGDAIAKGSDLSNLVSALGVLGDTAAGDHVAEWMTAQPAWRSWDTGDLAALATALPGDSATVKAARLALGDRVVTAFLTDEATITATDVKRWWYIVRSVRGDLPAATKTVWLTKLRSAFAAKEVPAAQLTYLSSTLQMLGEPADGSFFASWVDGVAVWKTWSPADLPALQAVLTGDAAAVQAARQKVTSHVASAVVPAEVDLRTAGAQAWQEFSETFGSALPSAKKAEWAGKLRLAFAAAEMGRYELAGVAKTLACLGDSDVTEFTASWIVNQNCWQDWSAWSVFQLPGRVRQATAAAKAARLKVVAHVTASYLIDPAKTAEITPAWWGSFAAATGGDVSAEVRRQWVSKFRAAFGTTATTFNDVNAQARALRAAGDEDWAGFVSEWMVAQPSWRQWPTKDLSQLARLLDHKCEGAPAGRALLGSHVASSVLSDATAAKQAGLKDLEYLVSVLAVDFTVATRQAWIAGLHAAFAPNAEALKTLSPADCAPLIGSLSALGDAGLPKLAVDWLSGTDRSGWSETKASDVIVAIVVAAQTDKAVGVNALDELGTQALAAQLSIGEKLAVCRAFVNGWRKIDENAKAQQWAMNAYGIAVGTETARATASVSRLAEIATLLDRADLIGCGKGYPSFAAAIVTLIGNNNFDGKAGMSDEHLRSLSLPLGTALTRTTVQDAMFDSQGMPRLPVLTILTWANRQWGDYVGWRSYVAQQVAEAEGDGKAIWLLGKAFVQVVRGPRVPVYGRGKDSLDLAMGAAESPAVRLAVARELTTYYDHRNRLSLAVSFMESIAGQFEGDALAELRAMQTVAKADAGKRAQAAVDNQAAQVRARKRSSLLFYKERLEIAKSQGDAGKITKLGGTIASLEAELDQ